MARLLTRAFAGGGVACAAVAVWLMYAATVDEGDIETLKALLAAGADRSIRNDQGRTAFEQARRYRHMAIADALK